MNKPLKDNNFLIESSFQRYLIPSILAILSGNISFMADHIIAGRVLGSDALAVMSMVNPLFFLFTAAGMLLCAGSSAMASVCLGKEDRHTAHRLFTLTFLLVLIFGGLLTAAGCVFLDEIADIISGGGELKPMIREYCRGLIPGAVGIIAVYLPLNYFRIEGKGHFGVMMFLVMTVLNIALDLFFTLGMEMGVYGLALATTLSSFIAVALTLPLLFIKAGYRFTAVGNPVRLTRGIMITGSPLALNNFYSVIRTWVLNILILASGGPAAAAAFAFAGSVNTLAQAAVSGIAQTVSPLVGVFYGEHDTQSVRRVIQLAVRVGVLAMGAFGVLAAALSKEICVWFGLTLKQQQDIAVPALTINAASLLIAVINQIFCFYYTTVGRTKIANLLTLCRGLVFSVSTALLLSRVWGVLGIWLSFLAGELLTFATLVILVLNTLRHEKELSGFLLLNRRDAEEGKSVSFSVDTNMDAIMESSDKISEFCERSELSPKQSVIIGLAIEEILVLLLKHIFKGKSDDTVDIKIFVRDEKVTMRLRCAGRKFNPLEFYKREMEKPDSPEHTGADESMGLKLVLKMAKRVDYTTNLGMNNIIIRL